MYQLKKKWFLTLSVLSFVVAGNVSFADESSKNLVHELNVNTLISAILADQRAMDLIEWKVGDKMNYEVNLGSFLKGSSEKEVMSEANGAIWIKQVIDLSIQKEVIEMLIRRSDAKVLEMKRNGQSMEVPDQNLEIVSQDFTTITVPAGTFKVIHVVAKSKDIEKLEVWANPTDTVMDGAVKQYIKSGMIDITFQLLKFERGK